MSALVQSMAYVGQTPWHQLGNALPPRQSIDVWARSAGMDWSIRETPVRFMTEQAGALGCIRSFDDQKVLYRSDTQSPLSVVSNRYQVVQPKEVLEFYRDLTEISGYELETAGVLKAGKKFWALARTGKETALKGNDVVKGYLLLATSCDGTGLRVRRINAVLQHPQEPWMLANVDREVIGSPDVQLLECKTAGYHGARLWEEGVPEYVQLQVLHQLAVTGKQAADVAVLICGQELRIHRIERDEKVVAQLIELERRFWRCVETGTAPPADGSDSADQALRALYPQDKGQSLDLSGDFEMSAAFSDLLALRELLGTTLQREAAVKQRIQQRMGEATQARFDSGDVSWKRSKDGTALDVDRLLAAQPELATTYALARPGSRRFLVKPAASLVDGAPPPAL